MDFYLHITVLNEQFRLLSKGLKIIPLCTLLDRGWVCKIDPTWIADNGEFFIYREHMSMMLNQLKIKIKVTDNDLINHYTLEGAKKFTKGGILTLENILHEQMWNSDLFILDAGEPENVAGVIGTRCLKVSAVCSKTRILEFGNSERLFFRYGSGSKGMKETWERYLKCVEKVGRLSQINIKSLSPVGKEALSVAEKDMIAAISWGLEEYPGVIEKYLLNISDEEKTAALLHLAWEERKYSIDDYSR